MVCKCKILDFPCETNYDSFNKTLQKWFRFTNVVLQSFLFLFLVIYLGGEFFLYISYWAVFLTFIYFLGVSLSYQTVCLRPICYILFEGILPITWFVTILWWCLTDLSSSELGLGIVSHHIPILSITIDFILSKIEFQRSHYICPFSIVGIWISLVLIPATFKYKVLYSGITFKNYFTYLIFLALVCIIIIVFEIARFVRVRSCKSRKPSHNPKEPSGCELE